MKMEDTHMTAASKQERPRLGDFTRPSSKKPGDTVPESAKVPVTPKTPLPPQKEEDPPAEMTPPETPAEKTAQQRVDLYQNMQEAMLPIENYQEHLAQYGISEEKAARIVDDLLTQGYYEEDFPISKRVNLTLRTREHRDTIRMQIALQVQRPLFSDTLNELVSRYNLAASLAAYNGKRYDFPSEDDADEKADKLFDVRLKKAEHLPAAVFSMATMLLAKFDRMILAVMREGVAENF